LGQGLYFALPRVTAIGTTAIPLGKTATGGGTEDPNANKASEELSVAQFSST
jgi:hypothetical protein